MSYEAEPDLEHEVWVGTLLLDSEPRLVPLWYVLGIMVLGVTLSLWTAAVLINRVRR